MRKGLLLIALLVILLVTNLSIYQKERLLSQGNIVRLALAPVDPRALLQGDYMALTYALDVRLHDGGKRSENDRLIVTLDEQKIATDVEWDSGQSLAGNQHYLHYYRGSRGVSIASDAWYFQEGEAEIFAAAKYGELRVAEDGTALLVNMLDNQLKPLAAAP
nr:GDYXXLXY domain-containing protein [Pantoea sp. 201603H]